MALTFGNAISNNINCGSAAILDNIDPHTELLWVRLTSFVNGAALWGKNSAVSNMLILNGVGGNLEYRRSRATTNTSYITNDTPLATTNKWYCVAMTFDSTATPAVHIYTGDLNTTLVERTYGTATDGVGTISSDAVDNFGVGNASGNASPARSWNGQEALILVWNRALTLGELKSQQFFPRRTSGCILYLQIGFNGTGTQPDWSGNGNAGTVNGATAFVGHVPLGPMFGFNTFNLDLNILNVTVTATDNANNLADTANINLGYPLSSSDDLNVWADTNISTLGYNLNLSENANNLTDPTNTLLNYKYTTQNSINNWLDNVAVGVPLLLSSTDDLNSPWLDAISTQLFANLTANISDDANLLSDSLLAGHGLLTSDTLSLSDQIDLLLIYLISLQDDLNNLADFSQVNISFLVFLSDNINNLVDIIIISLGYLISFNDDLNNYLDFVSTDLVGITRFAAETSYIRRYLNDVKIADVGAAVSTPAFEVNKPAIVSYIRSYLNDVSSTLLVNNKESMNFWIDNVIRVLN